MPGHDAIVVKAVLLVDSFDRHQPLPLTESQGSSLLKPLRANQESGRAYRSIPSRSSGEDCSDAAHVKYGGGGEALPAGSDPGPDLSALGWPLKSRL